MFRQRLQVAGLRQRALKKFASTAESPVRLNQVTQNLQHESKL